MRRIIIFIAIGIMLLILARYFAYTLSPFNIEAIQEISDSRKISPGDWQELDSEIINLIERGLILEYLSTNAYIGFVLFLGGIFCLFIAFHMSIDKLFFKFFYESASLVNAARRGLVFCIVIFLMFYFKLKAMDKYYILMLPIIGVVFEYSLNKYFTPYFKDRIEFLKTYRINLTEKFKVGDN